MLAPLAHAQEKRDLKPGLNYTTLAKPAAPTSEAAKEATAETTDQNTTDPATRVWNKYKELATGEAAEKEAAKKEAKAETPKKPSVEKPEKPSLEEKPAEEKKFGFGAILEQWKSSKDDAREMKSRSFKTPPSKTEDPS